MADIEAKSNSETIKKYMALMFLINESEKRLNLSELFFLLLNLAVALFSINYISTFIVISADYVMQTFNIFFVLCCFAFGISICSYWITFSMRLQLKLKLRYFQARYMERKMDSAGEFIFSDEAPYFSPLIHKLESPDNKETLLYPSSGALRMDGFAGNAQPRHLSLFMPSVFIVIYLAMTLGVILKLYY